MVRPLGFPQIRPLMILQFSTRLVQTKALDMQQQTQLYFAYLNVNSAHYNEKLLYK